MCLYSMDVYAERFPRLQQRPRGQKAGRRKPALDILSYYPEVILARERRRWQKGAFLFLPPAVGVMTVIQLINPAATEENKPICEMKERRCDSACFKTLERLYRARANPPDGMVENQRCLTAPS